MHKILKNDLEKLHVLRMGRGAEAPLALPLATSLVGPLALPAAVMPVLAYMHFELNIYNPYASHNAWLKNRLMAHSGSSALEFDLHHEA